MIIVIIILQIIAVLLIGGFFNDFQSDNAIQDIIGGILFLLSEILGFLFLFLK